MVKLCLSHGLKEYKDENNEITDYADAVKLEYGNLCPA